MGATHAGKGKSRFETFYAAGVNKQKVFTQIGGLGHIPPRLFRSCRVQYVSESRQT